MNRETVLQRENLKGAMGKVENARDGKAGMDHELRKWSSENGRVDQSLVLWDKNGLVKSKPATERC